MENAKLTPQLWGRMAGLLLESAEATALQHSLVNRFLEGLEDPSQSLTDHMRTLCVALSAMLALPASGSGAVETTSPGSSVSSRSS